jgi:hypothetical protein
MHQQREATEGPRPSEKRMLAAGAKINGTWQVTTFLRPAGTASRQPFWEGPRPRTRTRRV